jgi:hypothetical protein
MLVIRKRYNRQKWWAAASILTVVGVACLVGGMYAARVTSPSRGIATQGGAKTAALPSQPSDTKILAVDPPPTPQSTDCTATAKKRVGLATAASAQLKKLAQYEAVCGSGVISRLSFFVPTPTTVAEARAYAADVITQLRTFAKYNVQPVVFFEPNTTHGKVSLSLYRSGAYNTALDTYFKTIKQAGITNAMMGTWVPIPEGNLPEWTSVNPIDFVGCVTRAATYQKKYFPTSRASIMLDTMTYTTPGNYDNGRAISLLPFIKNIPSGLIDSFGLQGFPWSPPATEKGTSNGLPKDYLRVAFAAEAARALKVKYVWLNTGTFATAYAGQKGQVTATPVQRLSLLNDVVGQVKLLQAQGFSVSVHMFNEDKSRSTEGIDWSYWHGSDYAASKSTYVFKTFAHDLKQLNVPLWLFDTME